MLALKPAALLLVFLLSPCRAETDPATLKMVEFFVESPVADLPSEHIDEFLAVDAAALPKKLREPFQRRKLELLTLKQLSHAKKKGILIASDDKCEIPHEAKSGEIKTLKYVGYQEITDDEKEWVEKKTKCTERQMLCDFTLQIVDEKKPPRRRYLLYCKGAACDPLYVLIGLYRAKLRGESTKFFGSGGPSCTH